MLSGRGLCDELITRPEESYRLCCVVVCDLQSSRMGAPYIYDISRLRVNFSWSRSNQIFYARDAQIKIRILLQNNKTKTAQVKWCIIQKDFFTVHKASGKHSAM